MLVPVLICGSETMIWKEKERSKISGVRMCDLRSLLGIRKMDKVSNARIRELCRVTKEVDKRINESVLQWFGHVESMEENRIAKRFYVRECGGSRSVGK